MPPTLAEPLFPITEKPSPNALETLSVRVPGAIANQVRELAALYNRSQGDVIAQLVTREIARNATPAAPAKRK